VGGAGRTLTGTGITNFNVNGNRNAENNFSVDGMTMTAMGGAPNGEFTVSQDSISEVKVLLSNYQAEYGRLAGSNVVMVTKSGSQQFHGMAEYYVRNEDLNAYTFRANSTAIAISSSSSGTRSMCRKQRSAPCTP
jgi:hypothetical protein